VSALIIATKTHELMGLLLAEMKVVMPPADSEQLSLEYLPVILLFVLIALLLFLMRR